MYTNILGMGAFRGLSVDSYDSPRGIHYLVLGRTPPFSF